MRPELWDAVIVGGGLAGLSAAIYLERSRRRTLLIDDGQSMARWEPEVKNFLGFPEGLSGGATIIEDTVVCILGRSEGVFLGEGSKGSFCGKRLLPATGLTHLLPKILGAKACLGRTVLFCKDCDAYRMQGKRFAVYGTRELRLPRTGIQETGVVETSI